MRDYASFLGLGVPSGPVVSRLAISHPPSTYSTTRVSHQRSSSLRPSRGPGQVLGPCGLGSLDSVASISCADLPSPLSVLHFVAFASTNSHPVTASATASSSVSRLTPSYITHLRCFQHLSFLSFTLPHTSFTSSITPVLQQLPAPHPY